MAPKKKTKKPAANPARGFATTSTASKSKAVKQDEPSPADPPLAEKAANDQTIQLPVSDQAASIGRRDVSELTPDELEAQLEEDDLQNMLDSSREKSQRDVRRLVSRLKTERRLIRNSSERLELQKWLPEDMRESAMKLVAKSLLRKEVVTSRDQADRLLQISEDEIAIKVWTLKRALHELGFMADRSHLAIIELLENPDLFISAQTKSTKEGIWGLEECTEWLAFQCEPEELPGYDSHVTPKGQRLLELEAQEREQGKQFHESNKIPYAWRCLETQLTNLAEACKIVLPKNDVSTGGQRTRQASDQRTMKSEGLGLDEDSRSSDSDIEPVRQLEKYLQFKTRLHKRRPDLTEVAADRKKKAKGAPERSPGRLDPSSSRLVRRIRALERDLLFDKEEAQQRWAELRLRLVAEEVEERKRAKVENGEPNGDLSTPVAEKRSVPDEDDSSIGLGEFFASLPEPSDGISRAVGTTSTLDADGVKLLVRDFGTTTGMSPRRILEEACKAR